MIVLVCASRDLKSELIRGYLEGTSPYAGPAGTPWRVLLAFQIGMRLS
ncbi:hypothetical protein V1283_006964 [Bradyrhizobium sp. AZCC 2262]